MTVPRVLVLTDRHAAERCGRSLVETVTLALAGGAPAVVLREKDLPRLERRQLADALLDATGSAGARLLVASDMALAREVGADGVHLAADDPMPVGPTPVDPTLVDRATAGGSTWLVGRSCHAAADVRAAVEAGAGYVTMSPVAPTPSKPGYGPPLGVAGVADAVAAAAGELPVLALGGVTAENAEDWLTAGAHGVAVMGAVMTAADPAAYVRSLRAARPTEAP